VSAQATLVRLLAKTGRPLSSSELPCTIGDPVQRFDCFRARVVNTVGMVVNTQICLGTSVQIDSSSVVDFDQILENS
jgi:hypothetical protein